MKEEIIEEIIEFSEELYQKNIQENEFAKTDELEGIGDDTNANN